MRATEIYPAKGPDISFQPPTEETSKVGDGERIVQDEEAQNLRRGLEQRHTQMIAIAGAIVSATLSSSQSSCGRKREIALLTSNR